MNTNRILMCLDYNDTIDNLIHKCAEHESGGKFPTFFRGVLSMAVATKSDISIAIISSAHVDDIKEEINIINYYANSYCKLAIPNGESLINYIVGDRSKELYNCNSGEKQAIGGEGVSTKKEGVETILSLPSEQGVNMLVTGGDTKEDLAMIDVQTDGVPNVFIAPKANKDIAEGYEDALTIRDPRNNNSEGIGRCLMTLSKSLEEFHLTDAFSQKSDSEESTTTDFAIEQSTEETLKTVAANHQPSSELSQEQQIPSSNSEKVEIIIQPNPAILANNEISLE